jgi:hypothetical protein
MPSVSGEGLQPVVFAWTAFAYTGYVSMPSVSGEGLQLMPF